MISGFSKAGVAGGSVIRKMFTQGLELKQKYFHFPSFLFTPLHSFFISFKPFLCFFLFLLFISSVYLH